ncbi:hypothetical protein KAJ89_02285 [Candidatus Parcubacteria bacterium]|nr:hypothetical protein [Candidatus Parcubacteria bacterium]
MNNIKTNQKGIAALILVVVIGAVVLVMGKSLAFIGLSHSEAAQAYSQGNTAEEIAATCAEEVVRRFQIDENYSASDKNISIGTGQCIYTTATNGQERTIKINTQYNNYYFEGVVVINVNSGTISIINWGV